MIHLWCFCVSFWSLKPRLHSLQMHRKEQPVQFFTISPFVSHGRKKVMHVYHERLICCAVYLKQIFSIWSLVYNHLILIHTTDWGLVLQESALQACFQKQNILVKQGTPVVSLWEWPISTPLADNSNQILPSFLFDFCRIIW